MASNGDALVAWINACKVVSPSVEGLDDLADGEQLSQLLRHFLPDKFSGRGGAEELQDELDSHFQGKLGLLMSGEDDFVIALAEAALLAAIDCPKKDEAVRAILTLNEVDQAAIKGTLQKVMAKAAGSVSMAQENSMRQPRERGQRSQGGYLSRRREGGGERRRRDRNNLRVPGNRSPGASSNVGSRRSSLGGRPTQRETLVRQLRERLMQEVSALEDAQRSEETVADHWRAMQHDLNDEEQLAMTKRDGLATFWRTKGEDLRKGADELNRLDDELRATLERIKVQPEMIVEAEAEARSEASQLGALHIRAGELESLVAQAEQGAVDDDDSAVQRELYLEKREHDKVQKELFSAENKERTIRAEEGRLFERIQMAQGTQQGRQDSLRHTSRNLSFEEQAMKDAVDMLEFRKNEYQSRLMSRDKQRNSVMLGLDDEQDDSPMIDLNSTSMQGTPSYLERRSLEAELSEAWKERSKVEAATDDLLSEQRTIDRQLRNLEDRAAQQVQATKQAQKAKLEAKREADLAKQAQQARMEAQVAQRAEIAATRAANARNEEAAHLAREAEVRKRLEEREKSRAEAVAAATAAAAAAAAAGTSPAASSTSPGPPAAVVAAAAATHPAAVAPASAASPASASSTAAALGNSSYQVPAAGGYPQALSTPELPVIGRKLSLEDDGLPEDEGEESSQVELDDDDDEVETKPEDKAELSRLQGAARTEKDLIQRLRNRLREEEEKAKSEAAAATSSDIAKAGLAEAEVAEMEVPEDEMQKLVKAQANSKLEELHNALFQKDLQLQTLKERHFDRRAAMRGELTLLTNVMHEVTIRCNQLLTRHRLVVLNRAIEEQRNGGGGGATASGG